MSTLPDDDDRDILLRCLALAREAIAIMEEQQSRTWWDTMWTATARNGRIARRIAAFHAATERLDADIAAWRATLATSDA